MANLKFCPRCKIEKSLSTYGTDKSLKDNLAYYCKECTRIIGRERYRKNVEKYRKRKREYARKHKVLGRKNALKNNYDITLADYDRMFEEQDGNCAICGLPELMRRLSVDHDHTTGEVRGLLCSKCNFMLGNANDDLVILEKAVSYLKGGVSSQI